MGGSSDPGQRDHLLSAVSAFILAVAKLPGVRRIALLGSICTPKQNPKDVDVIVTAEPRLDLAALAVHGRRLKGRAQTVNRGADIFLATADNEYLGRICRYRECRPRRACRGRNCGLVPHLNDDLDILTLPQHVIDTPPLTVWPEARRCDTLPGDVEAWLLELTQRLSTIDAPPDSRLQQSAADETMGRRD